MTITGRRRSRPRITARQWQVAELVALGYPNSNIAEQLGISLAGAKYHVSELLRRLDLTRREEVADWYRSERVIRSEAVDEGLFELSPVSEALTAAAEERGWPRTTLERARRLRVGPLELERWVRSANEHDFERWLSDRELMMFGTLRVRQATLADSESLSALFAHATEADGDDDVVVERSPYAFAQFRLQDEFHTQLVEDRGVALATVTRAYPEVRVAGRHFRIEYQYVVVRDEARGHGYSRLMSHPPRPAQAWPVAERTFYYLRPSNKGAHGWLESKGRTSALQAPSGQEALPGFPSTVHYLAGEPPPAGKHTSIRPARARDLEVCANLINSAHREVDFFVPASPGRLARRLERGGFSDLRQRWPRVYGWENFLVAERDGRVVACAGYWDAGEHVREIRTNRVTGTRRMVESGVLLDVGFHDEHPSALVDLIHYVMHNSRACGRDRLALWLGAWPEVRDALYDAYDVSTETRLLQCSTEGGVAPETLTSPYVDLAYW